MIRLAAIFFFLLFCPLGLSAQDRNPAVAGMFYPGSRVEIEESIKHFFETIDGAGTGAADPQNDLIGIVVPHAGWVYSGKTAARAFAAIKSLEFTQAIFIGVDHRSGLNEIGLWPSGNFVTPFAKTPIDEALSGTLLEHGLTAQPLQHREEHSLEVVLPFFQFLFSQRSAVFISCGGNPQNGFKLAKVLKQTIETLPGRTLFIVSTDWSHYHNHEKASEMDKKAIDSVLALDANRLLQDCRSGHTELCGLNGVISAIEIFAAASGSVELLEQTDSSAASGERDRVVGYAALLLQGKKQNLKQAPKEEKKEMTFVQQALGAARKTLEARLRNHETPQLEFSDPRFNEKCGVFVTLKKHGELRGCIGYIIGYEPLKDAIPQMALAAALKDSRFRPVSPDELDDISIEISVLSPMQDVKDVSEIKIGRDGLLLQVGGRSGLLLPQVPLEWNWDVDEFLKNLCYKAGLPEGAHLSPQARLQRFSAEVFGEE